jgi:hypothetical protein
MVNFFNDEEVVVDGEETPEDEEATEATEEDAA